MFKTRFLQSKPRYMVIDKQDKFDVIMEEDMNEQEARIFAKNAEYLGATTEILEYRRIK